VTAVNSRRLLNLATATGLKTETRCRLRASAVQSVRSVYGPLMGGNNTCVSSDQVSIVFLHT
jgi:hypothetical protein